MKKMKKSALAAAVLLSLSMMGSAYADTTGTSVSAGQKINFGSYWQTLKKGAASDSYNQNDYNKDAIIWRVLSYDGTGKVATLLSDKVLYADAFDGSTDLNTWSTSEIKATLNGDFMGDAFITAEQGLIVTKTYDVLEKTGEKGEYGELGVTSKLYLLDYNDVKNWSNNDRKAQATDFAQNVMVYDNAYGADVDDSGNTCWWLRSPDSDRIDLAYTVTTDGRLDVESPCYGGPAVRPALDLDLSDVTYTSAATKSSSSDAVIGKAKALQSVGTVEKFIDMPEGFDGTVDVTLKDTSNTYTSAITASTLALDGSNVKMTLSDGNMSDAQHFASAKFDASESGSVVDTSYLIVKKGEALSGEQTMNIGGSLNSGKEYSLQLANEYHLGDGSIYYATTTDVGGSFSADAGNVNYAVGAGDLAFDVTVGANNKVILTDGTLAKNIVGEGITVVAGAVSADASNIQTKTDIVEKDKTLTLIDGELIADTVINEGNLKFDGATDVEADIIGSGDMYIFQSINMKGNLRQSSVNISEGKSFTNTGKVMTEALNADFSKGTSVNTSGEFISDKVVSVGMNNTMKAENTVAVGNNTTVSGSNSVALGNDTIVSGDGSVALGDGSKATADNVVSVGDVDAERKIVNVADGTDDTDAATYGQLKQVDEKIDGIVGGDIAALEDKVDSNVSALNNRIDHMGTRINKVGAGAAALAAMHPVYDEDSKLTFSAGLGAYRNEKAAAVGMFYRFSPRVMMNAGATVGNDNNMYNVGLNFALDRHVRGGLPSKAVMAKQLTAQSAEIADLKAKMAKLLAMIEEMKNK